MGSQKPNLCQESMRLNWNFKRGREGDSNQKPFVDGYFLESHIIHEALTSSAYMYLCSWDQFNKTFTSVIYKCSHCFQPLKQ